MCPGPPSSRLFNPPQALHWGTPTGLEVFPSSWVLSHVMFVSVCLDTWKAQRGPSDLAIRQLTREQCWAWKTTEHCQHKPCLSEEAAELWLQQMSYRLWDDTGSVLNIAYTFCLLNSLVHEVTIFPGPECLLNNWNMTCMEWGCLYKLANWEPVTSWAVFISWLLT